MFCNTRFLQNTRDIFCRVYDITIDKCLEVMRTTAQVASVKHSNSRICQVNLLYGVGSLFCCLSSLQGIYCLVGLPRFFGVEFSDLPFSRLGQKMVDTNFEHHSGMSYHDTRARKLTISRLSRLCWSASIVVRYTRTMLKIGVHSLFGQNQTCFTP